MAAFLSVMGMYNFNSKCFDKMALPDGLERETLIHKILFEHAELGLVYTDPDIFPEQIKMWSNSNLKNWQHILDALEADYNPIHNYNMNESWEDHRDDVGKRKNDTVIDGTSKLDVAGFNENEELVDNSLNTDKTTSTNTDDNNETSDSTHTGRRSGNIGVTTSQQMLESEVALRIRHNIYQIISDSFKTNFCIMVY